MKHLDSLRKGLLREEKKHNQQLMTLEILVLKMTSALEKMTTLGLEVKEVTTILDLVKVTLDLEMSQKRK